MIKRWKITIEYNGTNYAGWQTQSNVRSVQEEIEKALYAFCQQKIRIQAAGRTDSGVHAHGQVAHFDLDYGDRVLDGFALINALNAHLRPQPIAILKAEEMDADFHARFSAKNKLYHYRILHRNAPAAFEQKKMWHIRKKLDLKAMQEAAKHLVGHHDFTSFRASECQAKNPVRTLERLDLSETDYDDYGGTEILIAAEAQSFLHHQVRNMAGSLVLVGKGKWQPSDIKDALEARDRKMSGPTAPAHGLSLVRIDY